MRHTRMLSKLNLVSHAWVKMDEVSIECPSTGTYPYSCPCSLTSTGVAGVVEPLSACKLGVPRGPGVGVVPNTAPSY